MDQDPQSEVLAFLAGGALGAAPERIDTHAAIVLLVGERAYKLKRAVRYSFLDFTTLEARERTLRHELALNRRTAPTLYRRVLPVTREADGSLAVDGTGQPVEWLLEMRRFPAEAQLDRIAAAGGLTPELIEALAEAVAAAHAAAGPRPDCGGLAAMRAVADGNREDFRMAVPTVFAPEPVRALVDATEAWLVQSAGRLEARRAAGRVRHCHGDLHLANIVLLDGRPVLYDCIEFDDELACIDVLYDLAFLLMDLVEKGHRAAAARLLNAWLERTADHDGLALLPLFLSVRAAIRAKVLGLAVLRGAAAGAGEAWRYLGLARDLLAPPPPVLLAIGGGSGTGKTSLARRLAAELRGPAPGAVVLRSDVIRKQLLGRAPSERLPPAAYRSEVSTRVFATIAQRAATCLAGGHSVIADAVYGTPDQRAAIEAVARRHAVPFLGVWLEAPVATRVMRVQGRRGDASDADAAVVRRQARALDAAPVAWHRVDAAHGPNTVAATVLAMVRQELGPATA